jgi:hypothetical protein
MVHMPFLPDDSRRRLLLAVAVLICASSGASWAFFHRKDYVLAPVLLGLSGFISVNGLSLLWIGLIFKKSKPNLQGLQGRVGDTLDAFEWPRWMFWQPLVRIQVEWVLPKADCEMTDTGKSFSERVRFERRLKAGTVTRRIRLEDSLGLWAWEFEKNDPVEFQIVPANIPPVGQVPRIHRENGHGDEGEGSADGDLLDFRLYHHGDSANRVLWKLYDRTGKLFVRKPEKSGSALVGIFLVCTTGDEPAAELAWYATNKEMARSQDFFGENWVFGTSAHFGAGRENSPPITSQDWKQTRETILSSGQRSEEASPEDLRQSIDAFIASAGSGLTSVVVLFGCDPPRLPAEGLASVCQFLHVKRGGDRSFLTWSLLQR